MSEEITIDNAMRIKFLVQSPIFSIETLSHMRAGAKGDATRLGPTSQLFKLANGAYVFSLRALKRVIDDGQVTITQLK